MTSSRDGNRVSLDVIIPTWNNPSYLLPCLQSIVATRLAWPVRTIIVNNGTPGSIGAMPDREVDVIEAGGNLGWEGGLKAGLAVSDAEFVVFCNDDIHIPVASLHWARRMLSVFRDPMTGAAGPASNCVMGRQSMFWADPLSLLRVPYLIGFFCMVRRSALDKVGGVATDLPGGDDLDLSIRLRDAGYHLYALRDVFVYHHGFKTGERVHGADWNSQAMTERTNNALIRRHGVQRWHDTLFGELPQNHLSTPEDWERHTVAAQVPSDATRVLEFGCGSELSVPQSIGVDRFPEGDPTYHRQTSAASVVADVFQPMPMFEDESADVIIARHILEHAIDVVAVLWEWRRILKAGGRLIVAMPNEDLCTGVAMDVEHKHAWTPDSFRHLAEAVGFKQIAYTPNSGNYISFVTVLVRAEA